MHQAIINLLQHNMKVPDFRKIHYYMQTHVYSLCTLNREPELASLWRLIIAMNYFFNTLALFFHVIMFIAF